MSEEQLRIVSFSGTVVYSDGTSGLVSSVPEGDKSIEIEFKNAITKVYKFSSE